MALIRSILMLLARELTDNTTLEVVTKATSRMTEETGIEARNRGFDEKMIEEYKTFSNGREITWWRDREKGIGGSMELLEMESMFETEPSLIRQCELYPDTDQDLRYFRMLDMPKVELIVGFFDIPGKQPSGQLYVLFTGDKFASGLDLDFKGYLEMAVTSRVYFYWQKVLLDIQDERESPEVIQFKKNMKDTFPDFNWDDYVNKYNSLRRSLQ